MEAYIINKSSVGVEKLGVDKLKLALCDCREADVLSGQ